MRKKIGGIAILRLSEIISQLFFAMKNTKKSIYGLLVFLLFVLEWYSYSSGNVCYDKHELYLSEKVFILEDLGSLALRLPFQIGVTVAVLKLSSFTEILLLEWQQFFDLDTSSASQKHCHCNECFSQCTQWRLQSTLEYTTFAMLNADP